MQSQDLTQQQRMQQRLTPQQVQFGRLLEMTAPQIEDEVMRELDENPALEKVEADDTAPQTPDDGEFSETAEQLQRADYASDDDIPYYRLEARNRSADDRSYEVVVADDSTFFTDNLESQLRDFDLDETDKRIATYIIGNLDDNGYLRRDLPALADDISIMLGTPIDLPAVEKAFRLVRTLEPAGIGATDLRDCLLLQIDRRLADDRRQERLDAHGILADHFDLFAKKHFDRIASQMHIDHDRMSRALDEIRHLNPKPGAALASSAATDRAAWITPDLAVEVDPNGRASVSLLSRTPELAIERSFDINLLPKSDGSRRQNDAYAFIRRRYDEASSFIRMLRMRGETLLAVMEAIVRLQPEFFTTFRQASIRPMILKDISACTGLDLSVISRATAGKYVLTPHGTFPLKMFFNERPKDDADTSSHRIIEAIRALIDAEDKAHPLSDQAIQATLQAQGYDIARRTIAKYRERAGLPVARLRKHF